MVEDQHNPLCFLVTSYTSLRGGTLVTLELKEWVAVCATILKCEDRSRGALEGIDPGTPVAGWSEDEGQGQLALLVPGTMGIESHHTITQAMGST